MLACGEQIHREWLGHGLELVWLHAPHALQAALAVQLDAGSHDEPAAYPGLAHFLEHMVFRGSRGFAPSDSLMNHVQAHGGQVNASTRGTRTLFHLQVAEAQLATACARLVDQLQWPLLDPAVQLAEREVLEAEFQLRGTDADTLVDAAVGAMLNPAHRAAAFHAGRRSSLPVEDDAFQTALHAYHQRIYRQAHVRVVVVSAQPAAEGIPALRPYLQTLAGTRDPAPRAAPPKLGLNCASPWQLQVPNGSPRGVLAIALEQDGQGVAGLLDYLNLALESSEPGSLADALHATGLAEHLTLRLLHAEGEQALLLAEFQLLAEGIERRSALPRVLLDLLQHCRQQLFIAAGEVYCRAMQAQRWPLLGALDKARHLLEQPDHQHDLRSLDAMIERLRDGDYLQLDVDSREVPQRRDCGFMLALTQAELPSAAAVALPAPAALWPPALAVPALLPSIWRGAQHPPPWNEPALASLVLLWADTPLPRSLQQRLQPLQVRAWQQGVRLDLRQRGSALSLQVLGAADDLPAVLDKAVMLLRKPWPDSREADSEVPGSGIALRQLLQALPQHLAGPTEEAGEGLPTQCAALLLSDDQRLPAQLAAVVGRQGIDCTAATPALGAAFTAPRWQSLPLPGNECALLLFIAQPPGVAAAALWQLLGQLLPTPFQRRLREELQLGYALYCGYRRFDGQAGLLFAVQSASADARAIWTELQHFIQQQAQVVAALDADNWNAAVERIVTQLNSAGSSLEEGVQTLCQAWLAGALDDYPHGLLAALASATPRQLADQLQHLLEQPWLVLSNQARPD